jgi:RNA polymerase Rpb4
LVFPLLIKKIREANFRSELAKGELLSILNLRPANNALLETAIEDLEERFNEDEQNRLVDIISEVLGRDEPTANGDGDSHDDNAMDSIENRV